MPSSRATLEHDVSGNPFSFMTFSKPASSPIRFEQRHVGTSPRLHYAEVVSDGPLMVLLHGIGMDWRVWQAVSRRLAVHYHLFLVDLRGHGASDKPEHGYSLAHYAGDIEDFLESLELEAVTLVGSSLGGAIAAVVEAPTDLVACRVLIDPPLSGGPVADAEMFEEILDLKHRPASELAAYLALRNPGSGSHLARAMSEMWHQAADAVIRELLAARDTYFAIDRELANVHSPTLVLQADPASGGVLSDDQAQRALKLLPHGAVKQMHGAGHAIHAYQPREFVDAILAFCR